ncbi:NUDIX domain-containing protein [Embleya sp. AB8]|uniref:NUDIX domain-containing protein n=1 Tax=Embleya sp. AB8 TaxID=3156304 RepID=UPI003C722B7A
MSDSRTVTAAGALFRDEADRLLLVRPTYKPGWEIPGGAAEMGESPLETCLRELREELALVPPEPLRLLVADWVPVTDRPGGMRWIFDGGVLTPERIGTLRLPPDELSAFEFVSPDQVSDYMPPRRARRVETALVARKLGCPVYLEAGEEPGGF